MSKTNMYYTRAAKYFLLQDFWVGFKLDEILFRTQGNAELSA